MEYFHFIKCVFAAMSDLAYRWFM